MADVMDSVGLLGRRLDHPVFGSITLSWLLWNYPIFVALIGAVGHPVESLALIQNYHDSVGFVRGILAPVISGLAYTFVAPIVYRWYLDFDDSQKRKRQISQGKALKMRPVSGEMLDASVADLEAAETAINMLRGEMQLINTGFNELDKYLEQVNLRIPLELRGQQHFLESVIQSRRVFAELKSQYQRAVSTLPNNIDSNRHKRAERETRWY